MILLDVALSIAFLIILPQVLHSYKGLDAVPRTGLALWGLVCVAGWLSVVSTFLRIAIGANHGSLARALVRFVEKLGNGHPLRGLGLSEVVGFSIAVDVVVLFGGGIVITAWKMWRLRSAQRAVLDLVSTPLHELDGVCLLAHPQPMAYYLPGAGGRVVMSTGALEILSDDELSAVVQHERGHARRHHGALLIPLQVLSSFFTFLPIARYAPTAMRSYLEMSADDCAREAGLSNALRDALRKAQLFVPAPQGSFAASDLVIERRIQRLDSKPNARAQTIQIAFVVSAFLSLVMTLVSTR
jgi:Zn-dependent protease with chaperone function